MTTKSEMLQLTASVNCIATKGTSNMTTVARAIHTNTFFRMMKLFAVVLIGSYAPSSGDGVSS
ncbi:hypothetical protein [Ardenticatena maritima]|uniref:hypothetical protein n=1 Tax=Ardenticatena maritima TaxID=872965 RepID=UPI0013791635|nr:hypothetical protein [Ardenticatena maritima]